MLDPVHNHALRLCLGAYRTSPSPSLCVLANEPPLIIIIIIYLLKKTTYSNRKASEQDRQAQGALTSALMVQVQ